MYHGLCFFKCASMILYFSINSGLDVSSILLSAQKSPMFIIFTCGLSIHIGDFCADSIIYETSNPLLIEKYSIILAHLKGHNA